MGFLKFFTGFSRARTVALGAILFVIVGNLIDSGFSMKMGYGAAASLFYFWLMFKLNLDNYLRNVYFARFHYSRG